VFAIVAVSLLAAALPLALGVHAYRQEARAKREESARNERLYRMLANSPGRPRR
jgi:hypothetical protein